jgi:UDP-N-acetylglucosamine 4-epimerase
MLGYAPTHRVAEGLRQALDWYVAHLSPEKSAV